MNHISDWLTHIDNAEDVPYLRSKLIDVSIRLMMCNEDYWNLIYAATKHLEKHALTKAEGYKLPHGTSGANLGIPWNMIAVVRNRGMEDARARVMLNPKIYFYGNEKTVTTSNCGSIRLPEPIKVERSNHIAVEWYDLDGKKHLDDYWPETGSFTIQHEVDHNLGILITDRQINNT